MRRTPFAKARESEIPQPLDTAIVIPVVGRGEFHVRRTVRSLEQVGARAIVPASAEEFRSALEEGSRWVLRAGSYGFARPYALTRSATRWPVFALGFADRIPAELRSADLALHFPHPERLRFSALLVDDLAALDLCRMDAVSFASMSAIVASLWTSRKARVFHAVDLDTSDDPGVRAAEVVSSVQIGGAERIAHSLARGLGACGVASRLFSLGRPTRTRLPVLEGEWHLWEHPQRMDRLEPLFQELTTWGVDVVHGHLLEAEVITEFANRGWPPVITVHNARDGWPAGTSQLTSNLSPLVLGCGRKIEQELREAGVRSPVRSVDNGVASTDTHREAVERLRLTLHPTEDTIALLVVANPRPQKRFDRIPEIADILAGTSGRPVVVAWAGEASSQSASARQMVEDFRAGMAARRLPLVVLSARTDMPVVYRSCDVLLNVSDWEGLPLSQLEALEAGLPIVVSATGATSDLSGLCGVRVLPATSPAPEFAKAIVDVLAPGNARPKLPARYSELSMTRRYARHLRSVARCGTHADKASLLLVTNNFSPGGAQSSARRLLFGLAERGIAVSALALQEDDDSELAHDGSAEAAAVNSSLTPGTRALRQAGIRVLPCLRGDGAEPFDAIVDRALEQVLEVRPTHILFWNALPEAKALFVEHLLHARLFDVSPGEMYYRSMQRYFDHPRSDSGVQSVEVYAGYLQGMGVKYAGEVAVAERFLARAVEVVPNGVPVPPRKLRTRRTGDPFRWGTAVRIHPDKRLEHLIEAFRLLLRSLDVGRDGSDPSPIELEILGTADAGVDDYARTLREGCRDLPVRWLGFSDDPGVHLDRWDGFVLVAEPAGCPNASLEAMASGLPVVATDVGGMSEQLAESAGLLVPRGDVEGLAHAMCQLVTCPGQALALASRGYERVRQHFSLDAMCHRYLEWLGLAG